MASSGTTAVTAVSLQLMICALAELPQNFSVLLLCVAPNPVPEMVMGQAPITSVVGEIPLMEGAVLSLVKVTSLLVTPPLTTVTGPLVVEGGT